MKQNSAWFFLLCHTLPSNLALECCSQVTVQSNRSEDNVLKAFGDYEIKPQTIIENHLVYMNHETGSHLVFSDYGWQVIPSTPEQNNPPLIRFVDCEPPQPSECPEKCINNGKWFYFKDGEDVTDESKSLSVKCVTSSLSTEKPTTTVQKDSTISISESDDIGSTDHIKTDYQCFEQCNKCFDKCLATDGRTNKDSLVHGNEDGAVSMADGSTNDNEIEAVTQEDELGNDKESNAMKMFSIQSFFCFIMIECAISSLF